MNGIYYFKNLATGNVLDSSFEGEAYARQLNHGDFQKWDVI